tara:strand:- start:514 stop:2376 length:1863 start_codon:yes stop_codon:yes gene_type:complete
MPPDKEYLLALKSEMQDFYQQEDKQIDRSRLVREMEQKVTLPAKERLTTLEFRDPSLTDQAFRTTASVGLNFPKFQLWSTPDRQHVAADEREAEHREYWARELFLRAGRQPGMHTFHAMSDGIVADGAGWTKWLWRHKTWEDRMGATIKAREKAAKNPRAPLPLNWQHVDVRAINPVWHGNEIGEVLEVTKRPRWSTLKRWNLGTTEKGNIVPEELGAGRATPFTTLISEVEFIEHWDNTHVTYLIAGENLDDQMSVAIARDSDGSEMSWEHELPRIPYFPAYGLMMNHWRNRKVGWGTIETMRYLVELRSFLFTLIGEVAARDAYPILQEVSTGDLNLQLQGNPKRAAEATLKTWLLRQIYTMPPGKELKPVPMPDLAPSLRALLGIVDEAIAKLETPRFTENIGNLAGAGFALTTVLQEREVRFAPLLFSLGQSLEEQRLFCEDVVRDNIKEKLWVFDSEKSKMWLGIGPQELETPMIGRAVLEPDAATTKLVEQRMLHEREKNGSLGMDQVIQRMGDNPHEVRIARKLHALRQSPIYEQLSNAALLAYLGSGDLEALTIQAEQMIRTGEVPGQRGMVAGGGESIAGQGTTDPGAQAIGNNAGQPGIQEESVAGVVLP